MGQSISIRYVLRLRVFIKALGFDFHDTFTLVVKTITIRLITTIALTSNWELFQLDVNIAFLNGLLEETI